MTDRQVRRATAHDLAATSPDRIRNVVLVGPSGAGKTTLIEGLLVASGAINRAGSIEDGATVSDFEDSERARHHSMSLAVCPLVHGSTKINLIDTPGYADFVGELRAGLRAADCALFVIGADAGIDEATRQLWRECAEVGMPRAVVISRIDHGRANVDAVLAEATATFGDKVLPLYVPRSDGSGIDGLLRESDDVRRGSLIEGVIEESEDETLMERYLGGETIDEGVLVKDLEMAVARGSFHPVIPVSGLTGVGCPELLDLIDRAFPSPLEHTPPDVFTPAGGAAQAITCDAGGPLVAEVVKTSSDQYVGRISLVRVFSGRLNPDQPVHVSGHFSSFFGDASGHEDHDEDERPGSLTYAFGAHQTPAPYVVAGDIAAVGRLTRAETGDTLSSPDKPLVLKPWSMPEPLLPIAIEAVTKSDEDKLSQALTRLAAEDPSLRIEHNAETRQIVMWVMGEAHAEAALERLRSRYGVAVAPVELIIPLRETFIGSASGHGRHVKQSGGHGQYAVCDVTVEPLPQGSGFEFVDKVVGGSVPRQFIPSVEKGVRAQMERGVRAGYPLVDIRVTLTEGKSHSVDSSDMAFQSAGALALREAAAATQVSMLEPYDEVAVVVFDDLVGPVMSDLSSRRGRLLGTDKVGDDRTLVKALVPQTELTRYAIDLRAATHGVGTFTRSFAHYEPMGEDQAKGISTRS